MRSRTARSSRALIGCHAPASLARGGSFVFTSLSTTPLKLSPGCFSALSVRYARSLREIVRKPMGSVYHLCTAKSFCEMREPRNALSGFQ